MTLRDYYGDDFIRQFGGQVMVHNDNPNVANAVVGKELAAGVSYSSTAMPLIGETSIKYTHELDITSGPVLYLAPIAKAPNRHAGQLFINWSMSPEGQLAWNGNDYGTTPFTGIEIEGVSQAPEGYEVSGYARGIEERDEILELFYGE